MKNRHTEFFYSWDFEPFQSAEEAWFWAVQGLEARAAGAVYSAGFSGRPRPCEPMDIFLVLRRLVSLRRLTMEHLKTLIQYGREMMPPDRRFAAADAQLWDRAMAMLGESLTVKGVIQ